MSRKLAFSRHTASLVAFALAATLGLAAAAQGLTPDEHGRIALALGLNEEERRELSDLALMDRLTAHAIEVLGLRLRASTIDALWALQPPPRDPLAGFEEARAGGRLDDWLRDLEPADPRYEALAQEARRYRAIERSGGWPAVAGTRVVRPGGSAPDIVSLRGRLAAEGYDPATTETPETLDAALVVALEAYQRRHGLPPDGVLGPATRASLAAPARARADQLEVNLERWRWLPRPLPADRIEVDVGGQTAIVFAGGEPALEMRVIVGDPRHHTPMFASRLEAVVFNPPWNVPASIARAEIAPRVARDPGYLARNRMVRTPTGFRQAPGPGNALGRLKFDLVSPFGVYLHDTSSPALFARPTRTLSHGCIRLEKPNDLAALVLAGQGWAPADVQAAIDAGATRRVVLDRPLSLLVVYRTASTDAEGRAVFGPDPYGWDRKLLAALAAT